MNSIDTIRRLNQVARDYYHHDTIASFDHAGYLRECFRYLLDYFSSELYVRRSKTRVREPAYLFAALTYKRVDGKKTAAPSNDIDVVRLSPEDRLGYYYAADEADKIREPFDRIIGELYQAIYEKRSMSVTEVLLKDKRKGKDLFLFSGYSYRWPVKPHRADTVAKIAFFPLSKLNYTQTGEGFETFYQHNQEQIEHFKDLLKDEGGQFKDYEDKQLATLLWYYRQLQEAYVKGNPDKEFLVHFIRPSFIESGYNILLSLGTKRRLTPDQLSIIYLFVHRIVSQTVLEKTKHDEKKVSSSYIFGIGHFLKHRISPVVSHLENAREIMREKYQIGDVLQNSILLAKTAQSSANILDRFGKALAKRTDVDKNYTEFNERTVKRSIDNEEQIQPETLKKHDLDTVGINIKELLVEIIDVIKKESGEEIRPLFEERTDWGSLTIKPYISFMDKRGMNISVCPSKDIYHQFLHELFRNINKSKESRALVGINYQEDGNCLLINREVSYSDAHNLEALGIGYAAYSSLKNEGLGGLKLIELYVDVLGIGTITHKLYKPETGVGLYTKLELYGLGEIRNG